MAKFKVGARVHMTRAAIDQGLDVTDKTSRIGTVVAIPKNRLKIDVLPDGQHVPRRYDIGVWRGLLSWEKEA